ncbi:alpha/beta hydrolase [Actinomadura sp. 6K520]|uniref:alpha/beta hydrolase n=1 Tax=Actinomadura sp. 6K520 TaxID=2530364 RepID=UPI001045C7BD|nr:alpha/beta hydrolase [Actinomadura sp. 6K520]TDE19058.1 alpha/beta hydrolase [Actinomadura sp. 6K520]
MPETVPPATLRANERLARYYAALPRPYRRTAAELRAAREDGRTIHGPVVRLPRCEDVLLHAEERAVRIRVSRPRHGVARGLVLHCHAGGFVTGSPDWEDERLTALADECGAVVAGVAYRLAPEHPYPAGLDDVTAALAWAAAAGRAEYGVDRVLVAGESAGANLAVLALIRLRERTGAVAVDGAALSYGFFDLRLTAGARRPPRPFLGLDAATLTWFREQYAPGMPASQPELSPVLADLSGLPPALLVVGTADPLHDDSVLLAERWRAAGGAARLHRVPGGAHGCDLLPFDSPARREIVRVRSRFIADILSGGP